MAEQLIQVDASIVAGIDTFTLIEMNDDAAIHLDREPLDWILFNKLLNRQSEAKPRSHGNYGPSIEIAKEVIQQELGRLGDVVNEDLPGFALVLLSDGKPSDKDEDARIKWAMHINYLSAKLGEKFSFSGMGIGASGSDFVQLQALSNAAKKNGGNGEFNHAGLSAANLGDGFSKLASSMSTVRSGLLPKAESDIQRDDEAKLVVPLIQRQSFAKSMDNCWKVLNYVIRCKLDLE